MCGNRTKFSNTRPKLLEVSYEKTSQQRPFNHELIGYITFRAVRSTKQTRARHVGLQNFDVEHRTDNRRPLDQPPGTTTETDEDEERESYHCQFTQTTDGYTYVRSSAYLADTYLITNIYQLSFIITIINSLTARVVGAPQMILQTVFSIFPCSPLTLGLAELQACPFPDVVFPPLPLSALSSSPFQCALQDGFGRHDEQETWPHHCSFRLFTMVRSSCGPISCWILARISSLVIWSLYEMRSILL